MTMMMKVLYLLASAFAVVDAATKIAVLEFGKGNSVRRTTSSNAETTVEGVASFWGALHHQQNRRKLQHAGMSLVPDLFKKPESGVVVGVSGSGVDLDTMPNLSKLVSETAASEAVGHMQVAGSRLNDMIANLADWENVDTSAMVESAKKHGEKLGLSGFKTVVDSASAHAVDQRVTDVLNGLKDLAEETGKNIVVHLVVEEEVASARRRTLSRRLEDEQKDENNNEQENQNNNGGAEGENQRYFGYGYYNDFGEWVTPYKTMFQIQYFNVVLWTAIGLAVVLYFTIYLMMYMPLEPDTLLFGESAKLPEED